MVDCVKLPSHDPDLTVETLHALMRYFGCGIHAHNPASELAMSPEEFTRHFSKGHPWMELKYKYSSSGKELQYLVGNAIHPGGGDYWVIKDKNDLERFKQLPPLNQSHEATALKSW